MTKITAKAVVEPVPAGTYKAKIKTHDVVGRKVDGKDIEYVDFFFEITEGDFKEREVKHGVPFNLSPKSYLGKLFKDITGKEVEPEKDYDLDDLEGIDLEITVKLESIKNKDNESFDVNRVAAVLKK